MGFWLLSALLLSFVDVGDVDLSKLPRKIAPPKAAKAPKYCCLVFGEKAERIVWLALDGDMLYVDRNSDGVFEGSEAVKETKSPEGITSTYLAGDLTIDKLDPAELTVSVIHLPKENGGDQFRVSARVRRDGAPSDDSDGRFYCLAYEDLNGPLTFTDKPDQAPIVHFGGPWTLALQFGSSIARGRNVEMYLCVGTPGVGPGTYLLVGMETGAKKGAKPKVRFVSSGDEQTINTRCCTVSFHGPVRADELLPLGKNEIVLAMTNWPEARIRDGRATIEIKPAVARKLEPVSAGVRKQFPLGKVKYFVPLEFLDDKTLLGWSENGAFTMNLENGRIDPRVPWKPEPRVLRVVLSPDKRTLFVGRTGMREEQVEKDGKTSTIYHQTGGLEAYSVASGKKLSLFEGREPTSVFEIEVSPDGHWLAFGERPKIIDLSGNIFRSVLWNLESKESFELLNRDGFYKFSPDSKQLYGTFVGNRGTKALMQSWRLPERDSTKVEMPGTMVFQPPIVSPDGKWLLHRRQAREDKKPVDLELIERHNEQVAWKTTLQGKTQTRPNFDPNSRYLALIDSDRGCRFLNLATLKESERFEIPTTQTFGLPKFSSDGSRFAFISQDLSKNNPSSADPTAFDQSAVWLMSVSNPKSPERIVLPASRAMELLWTPDGRSIVVRAIDRVFVLDATSIAP